MKKKLSRQYFICDEVRYDFVPGQGGSAINAYIRLEDREGKFLGGPDRLDHLKKLRNWCDLIIKARESK